MVPPKIRIIPIPEVPTEESVTATTVVVPEVPSVNSWIITDLPSKGLFYKSDLIGRPLTVLEVKKLATINESNVEEIVDSIITTAISGVNTQDILINDKLYILYWLRAQSFINDGFKVKNVCDGCGKVSEFHFSIANMDQDFIDDNYDESWLTITNFLNGDIITFRPRTMGDESRVNHFIKYTKNTTMDPAIAYIASQIKTINDKEAKLLEAYEYLTSSAEVFSVLVSQMNKIECGLSNEFKVKCSNKDCEVAGTMPITFRSDFMLPTFKLS